MSKPDYLGPDHSLEDPQALIAAAEESLFSLLAQLPVNEHVGLISRAIQQLPAEGQSALLSKMGYGGIEINSYTEIQTYDVDPIEIAEAFKNIIGEERHLTGPIPVQYQRIWNAFSGRENDAITIGEIAEEFPGFTIAERCKRASTAIYKLNAIFEGMGIHFRINSQRASRKGQVTTYRIARILTSASQE